MTEIRVCDRTLNNKIMDPDVSAEHQSCELLENINIKIVILRPYKHVKQM